MTKDIAKEKEKEMIQRFMDWGQAHDSVRAIILTSTRTSPLAAVDAFSDYDVIVAVEDIQPFLEDERWLEDFGEVLVLYRDPVHRDYGYPRFARITQYENGLKIDFTIADLRIVQRMAQEIDLREELDVGYLVLLDKDGLTSEMQPPSFRAFVPVPPSEDEYQNLIETFFHEGTYAVKLLWREELLPVKYYLDQAMKQDNLRILLEWRMEMDHDWSLKTGAFGKTLQRYLPPEIWAEVENTYVGAGMEENWQAFYRTVDLFRKVAIKVGEHLGYEYPHELDRRMMAYFKKVENLERGADFFTE